MQAKRKAKRWAFFLRNQIRNSLKDLLYDVMSTEKFWAGVDETFAEEIRLADAWLIFHEDKPLVSIADTGIQWCEHLEIDVQVEDYTSFGGPYKGEQEEEVRRQIENIDILMGKISAARARLLSALENVKEFTEKE